MPAPDAVRSAHLPMPDLPALFSPAPSVTPNYGFMTDQDGNRIESAFKTPRTCIKCGETFTPKKNPHGRVPEVCSASCRRHAAAHRIGAINADVQATRKTTALPPSAAPTPGPRPNMEPPTPPVPNMEPPTRPLPTPQVRSSNGRFASSAPSIPSRKDAASPLQPWGASIRRRRQAAGVTAGEVAAAIGCSSNAVFNWERCDVMIPADKLAALARFFGCTMEDIWYDRR